jgi:hypothetical protein
MKRSVLALVIGAAVFGSVYGLAAPSGASSPMLGTGISAVSACQKESIGVSFALSYVDGTSSPGYLATKVTLNDLNTTGGGCGGGSFTVALMGKGDTPIAEQAGIVPSSGTTASVVFPGVSVMDVVGVRVTISG